MRVWLLFLLLESFYYAKSQDAIIQLRDSVKLRSELVSTSDTQLFTKAGTLGISEIYSISFQGESDVQLNPTMMTKLLAAGVKVYANGKRIQAMSTQSVPPSVPTNAPIPSGNAIKNDPPREEKTKEESPKNEKEELLQEVSKGSFGIGFGQDYGALGARLTFLPDQHLGLYFSGGYAIAGFGYNAGALIRIKPENRTVPTFNVMYGYTAAISVSGVPQYDKIYYGPSLGAGFISKNRHDQKNFWHFEIILPFRPAEFDRDLAALQANTNIKGLQTPWPIRLVLDIILVFKSQDTFFNQIIMPCFQNGVAIF